MTSFEPASKHLPEQEFANLFVVGIDQRPRVKNITDGPDDSYTEGYGESY